MLPTLTEPDSELIRNEPSGGFRLSHAKQRSISHIGGTQGLPIKAAAAGPSLRPPRARREFCRPLAEYSGGLGENWPVLQHLGRLGGPGAGCPASPRPRATIMPGL